jgi:hypothetical protein
MHQVIDLAHKIIGIGDGVFGPTAGEDTAMGQDHPQIERNSKKYS